MKRIFTVLVLAMLGSGSLMAQNANIQFIDNIADPSVGAINVYYVFDGTVYDSVIGATFRTASPYLSMPGDNWVYQVYIVPGGLGVTSADTAGALQFNTQQIVNGSTYAIIASGLATIDTSAFGTNPLGLPTNISISVLNTALQISASNTRTDITFFNGVTDVPPITVSYGTETSNKLPIPTLFASTGYGSFTSTGYIDLTSSGDYILNLQDAYGNEYGYYWLEGLPADTAGIIFTSGFADSADIANSGNIFGLYVATAGGSVHPLEPFYPAFVQVIHDAPDTSIKNVELIIARAADSAVINEQQLTFGLTPATAYIPVISGFLTGPTTIVPDSLLIGFAPVGTTTLSSTTAYSIFAVGQLTPGSQNLFVTSGVLPANVSSYPANPEGTSTAFNLNWHAGVIQDPTPHTAEALFFQGIPDAPAINVNEISPDSVALVDTITYTSFNGYQTLDSAYFVIQITDSTGATVIQTYNAPLALAVGYGGVVYSGGFLTPTADVPYGLYGTFPDGTTLPLEVVEGINTVKAVNSLQLYPNPSQSNVTLSFNLANDSKVQYSLVNMLGQQIQFTDLGSLNAGTNTVGVDVANLSSGAYLLNLFLDNNTHVTRTIVINK